MNITLTDVLSKVNGSNQSGAVNSASASAVAKQLQTSAVLNSLVTGQTIGGQIRSMEGSQILLDMGSGVEINARLDGDIRASIGQHMLFEVKGNSDDKLMLSPLYTNLSAGKSAAMGALNAAGMPLTAENLAMVKSMMEEGLPIDKNSLWQMGKAAADFPQAAADTIVRLTAMGMEINETNVMQYEATKNMQHQLLYTMEDITEGLPQVLSSFGEDGRQLSGLQFMKDMLEVLQGAEGEETPVKGLLQEIDSLMKEIAEGQGGVSGKAGMPEEALRQLADEDGTVLIKDGTKLAEQGRLRLPDALEQRLADLQKDFTGQIKNLLSEKWTKAGEFFGQGRGKGFLPEDKEPDRAAAGVVFRCGKGRYAVGAGSAADEPESGLHAESEPDVPVSADTFEGFHGECPRRVVRISEKEGKSFRGRLIERAASSGDGTSGQYGYLCKDEGS